MSPPGGTTFGRPEGSKTKPRQMKKKGGINHEKKDVPMVLIG